MNKKSKPAAGIRVGVVGYGGAFNMGRVHLKEMERAGMIPSAVCETDPERRSAAESDFPGIKTYANLAAMLRGEDVDLVTIITPHNSHAKLALQCLKAGKHVVCEKPLALTTAECDAIISAAAKSGVVVSTYHNRHWDGCILQAIESIKRGKSIGEIVRIDARMGSRSQPRDWWRSSRSISGGILYDWGVHLLEYSLQLVDSTIVEVSGFSKSGFWAPHTAWKKDTIEDHAEAVVRFRNGAWLTMSISHLDSNPKPGFLEITGTEGSYVMLDHRKYQIHRRTASTLAIEEGSNPADEHHRFYENLAAHLMRGEKLVITPEWSRRPVHVIDLAVQSAKKGRTLPAKYQ